MLLLSVGACLSLLGQSGSGYIVKFLSKDSELGLGGGTGGLAVGPDKTVYVSDTGNHRVLKLSPNGEVSIAAGTGNFGFSGDNQLGVSAQLRSPEGLASDSTGNLYIADTGNNRIRKLTRDGIISTFAGTGQSGSTGDGGDATKAQLSGPTALAMDSAANMYIVNGNFDRLRKISSKGVITTMSNVPGVQYRSIAADGVGNIYLLSLQNRVYRVTPSGAWKIVAGTGGNGSYDGDDLPATSATFLSPRSLAADSIGNIYIADFYTYRVHMVTLNGMITSIAGRSYTATCKPQDGSSATLCAIEELSHVTTDADGSVYVLAGSGSRSRILRFAARITISSVTNAASMENPLVSSKPINPVSPGELVVLAGNGLGTAVEGSWPSNRIFGPLPTDLKGVTVSFGDQPAPIYGVSSGPNESVTVQVPFETPPDSTNIYVSSGVLSGVLESLRVVPVHPEVFGTDSGQGKLAVAVGPDGRRISEANPAQAGQAVRIYATGLGQSNPPAATNQFGVPGQIALAEITVSVNKEISIASAEYSLDLIGVYVVTFTIPADAKPGYATVVLAARPPEANDPVPGKPFYLPIR